MSTSEIKNFDHFLLWEQASRDAILVKRVYIDMAGDVLAGLMLSQIIYWHLPNSEGKIRLRVVKDGFYWLAKSHTEWWEECRLTVDQARRALKILQDRGLIVTALKQFNGAPTVHIRLDQENFLCELNRFGLQPKSIWARTQMDLPQNPNPFGLEPESYKQTLQTDTTTETTAAEAPPSKTKRERLRKASAAAFDFEEGEELTPEGLALSEELIGAGLNRVDAKRLAATNPEECRRQLDYLPFKTDLKNPGAYLRQAIEGSYGPPASYHEAKKQETEAQKKRALAESQAAKKAEAERRAEEAAAALDQEIQEMKEEDPQSFAIFEEFIEAERTRVVSRLPSIRLQDTMNREFGRPEKRRELYQQWRARAQVPAEAARMPL